MLAIILSIKAFIIQMQNRNSVNSSDQKTLKDQFYLKKGFALTCLKGILSFQRNCSAFTSGYVELPTTFVVLHSFLGYLLLSDHPFSYLATNILKAIRDAPALYHFLQIVIYLVNIMMIIVLFGCKLEYKNKLWFSSVKRVIALYSGLSKVLIFLTAMLLYINLEENLAAFLIATAVSIVDGLLFGNYCFKKDENYQSSHYLSFILRIGIIVNLLSNCFLVYFGQLNIFCIFSAFFGGMILLWHHFGGYQLCFHKITRFIYLVFCASAISFGLIYLLLACPKVKRVSFNALQFGLSFTAVLFYLYNYENKKRFSFIDVRQAIEKGNKIKNYELNMSILVENSDQIKASKILMAGIFMNSQKTCQNPDCWSKKNYNYDPLQKQEFDTKQLMNEKESLLIFYFQCIYSQAINQKISKENLLDYIQFAISEKKDFSRHCLMLEEIESQENLSFLDKIKIYKLKLILKEQSKAFNKLVHGGKIELDQSLRSAEIYEQIIKDINFYCKNSANIWNKCMSHEVNVGELKQQFAQNFELLPKIKEDWSQIHKFVSLKQEWKYSYLSFALFLYNQKIKKKDLDFQKKKISSFTVEDNEFSQLKQQDKTHYQEYSDSFFFDKNSIIIMCSLEEEKLKFVQENESFSILTGYCEREVRGTDLSLIYPEKIKDIHDKNVVNWMNSGRTVDESSYYIKHTYFLNKLQEEVPATVFFKLYIDLLNPEGLLKFGCIIKAKDKIKKQFNKTQELLVNEEGKFTAARLSNINFSSFLKQNQLQKKQTPYLTLNNVSNIFLKDQNLQPISSSKDVQRVRCVTLLLTLALIVVALALSLNIKNNANELDEEANSEIIVSNLYNLPFILGKYYYSQVIMPGPYLMPKIVEVTEVLKKYSENSLTKQILFNADISLPNNYPPYQKNAVNEGIVLSNTDVFYLIQSCITTLKSRVPKRTTHEFVMFNSYIKPAYDSVMNATKHQLHHEMNRKLKTLERYQIISMVSISFVLCFAVVYLYCKIRKYFMNMREVIQTIVQFSNQEIEKIACYWGNVSEHFRKTDSNMKNRNDDLIELSQNKIEQQSKEEENTNIGKATLNQKHKILVFTKEQQRKSYKICIMMILLALGYLLGIVCIHVPILNKITRLQRFQDEGYFLMKYYPTAGIIGYAFSNRYTTQKYPAKDPFNLDRFQDTLSTLDMIINHIQYKNIQKGSLFYEKINNYLYGNPCVYNSQLLTKVGYTVSTCTNLGGMSFSNGLLAYMRHTQSLITNFLRVKSDNINQPQLYSLSIGYSLVGYYLEDALQAWFQQFSIKIDQLYQLNVFLSLWVCALLIALYILIIECFIMRTLQADYQFMKQMFCVGVPQHVLTQEKVIKQRFIQSGILASN